MFHEEGRYFQDYVIWFLSHAKTAKKKKKKSKFNFCVHLYLGTSNIFQMSFLEDEIIIGCRGYY